MANFDKAITELISEADWSNYNGYSGEPPATEAEYNALIADNKHQELGTSTEAMGMFASGFTPPTWSQIQAQMAVEDVRYARRDTYPSIEDQLDMQYHDAVNGTTTWKDAIQAVKDANPKPTE